MSQNPLNAPLAFLKNPNANASASSFDQTAQSSSSTKSRSRSGSLMRVVYPNNSPPPALSLARRSLSVSESRRPSSVAFSTTTTDDFRPLHANYSATSLSQPSETNWAGRIDDFDVKNPIGYGSSAVVFSAIHKPSGKRVAIKQIDLDMFERNQIDELRRETALMALSKHPNVLRVYGSFVTGSKLHIVTPYLASGSCLDIMKSAHAQGLDELSIATILKQALDGLQYLHKNGHIHRDVKAGNLLMDEHGTVLLADFGVSSSLSEKGDVRKTFVGTPCWMAPEVMEQAGYDFSADIWSFGITALELAKGHAPFAKYPPMKVLMMILSNDSPTLDRDGSAHKYSKTFKDMIDSCLQKDASKRPTADKLLQHPFFKQARRKEHLVRTLLVGVPPLELRKPKKLPQKQILTEATEQWDFDTADEAPPTTRKHISFGDVVVRDPSRSALPGSISTPSRTQPMTQEVNCVSKKSRFVVEETFQSTEDTHPLDKSPTLEVTQSITMPIASADGQVKKGRFSVNQSPQPQPPSQQQQQQTSREVSDTGLPSLPRICSQESLPTAERKSRFEVQLLEHGASLTRENSSSSAMSFPRNGSTSSKSSRFSVEVETSHTDSAASPRVREPSAETTMVSSSPCLPECRKIGRFELSGGSLADIKPLQLNDALPLSEPMAHMCSSMEMLLKYTEAQRHLLSDMMTNMSIASGHKVVPESTGRKESQDSGAEQQQQQQQQRRPRTSTLPVSSNSLEQLQNLLSVTQAERDRLAHENEVLRRQVEELRQAQASLS
ncbi:kinase-like domain-containing protein [Syncephalastrum racemosum]|uniref:Kinase-like domain-containing protein n=1 Tax=Syncephalastrum racemosum TaxID=13706 RepID=A0A1X2HNG5_SYNRA|nr:kinase-like domain-containing protein [Syncephalastrum racemosum]